MYNTRCIVQHYGNFRNQFIFFYFQIPNKKLILTKNTLQLLILLAENGKRKFRQQEATNPYSRSDIATWRPRRTSASFFVDSTYFRGRMTGIIEEIFSDQVVNQL